MSGVSDQREMDGSMCNMHSQYPPLSPSGSLSYPTLPYFGLDQGSFVHPGYVPNDATLHAHTRVEDGSMYIRDDNFDPVDRILREDDQEILEGIPRYNLEALEANVPPLDGDFFPGLHDSDTDSDKVSDDSSVKAATEYAEDTGRRGARRGRGRGRGPSRGHAKGMANGRPRGSKARGNIVPRGDGARGGRRGKRGPRASAEPSKMFKELQAKATVAFLVDKDFETAAEYARQAIQVNPEIFASHSLLSEILLEMGKKEESLAVLWSGAHTKREAGIWWEVANRTAELGGSNILEELKYCYSQIISLDPTDYEAHQEKLGIYLEQGTGGRAIKTCETLLKLRPNNLETLQTLAELCAGTDEVPRAQKAYEEAVSYYQSIQENGYGGGFSFSDLNIYLELFASLNQWGPGITALRKVARWLCGRKDEDFWDSAQDDDCEWDSDDEPRRISMAGFEPNSSGPEAYGDGLPPEIRAKLGIFRLHLNPLFLPEALHHFEFLTPDDDSEDAIVHDYSDVFCEIGDALHATGHYTEALRFYETLAKTQDALDIEVYRNMAKSYEQSQQYDRAISYFKIVAANQPLDVDARVELAKIYERLGKPAIAYEHVSEVLRLGRADAIQGASLSMVRPAVTAILAPTPTEDAYLTPFPPKVSVERGKLLGKRKRHPTDKQEERQAHVLSLKTLFEQMQIVLPRLRNGDQEATSDWMDGAGRLVDEFKAAKIFFPSDSYIRFLGYSPEARRRAIKRNLVEQTEIEAMADRLKQTLGTSETTDSALDDSQPIPKDFQDILFTDWLDIFCELAFCHARLGSVTAAYAILESASNANVFHHDEQHLLHIHVCWFTCALLLSDEEKLCNIARWFIKTYPYASDTFRLYAALNRLYHGETSWYNSGPSQKFMLRVIKAMDFALLSDEQRKRYRFSEQERMSYASVNDKVATLDPVLLTLYGHILAAAGSYQNALNYYFRAYAVSPKDTMVVLSIGLAYLQYSIKRQNENRHYYALQGIAFLKEYGRLRLVVGEGGVDGRVMRLRRMEVEFNEARMWHMFGLLHLTVPGYERCLAMGEAEKEDVNMTGVDDTPGDGANNDDEETFVARTGEDRQTRSGGEQDSAMVLEEDFKREAAYALQCILAVEGEVARAREITEKYLVF